MDVDERFGREGREPEEAHCCADRTLTGKREEDQSRWMFLNPGSNAPGPRDQAVYRCPSRLVNTHPPSPAPLPAVGTSSDLPP